jgi:hypothetical protein
MPRSILQRLLDLIRTSGSQTPSGTPRSSAHCTSCGAHWGAGRWSDGCEECGGGGMSRNCPICQGRCGTTVRRAVIDSNDERCAHWIGACGLAPMAGAPRTSPAPVSRYLFRFGYQTPHQLRITARNPEWDEQDPTWIFIDADSEDEASRLGFAYADAFVRQLFEHEDRWPQGRALRLVNPALRPLVRDRPARDCRRRSRRG